MTEYRHARVSAEDVDDDHIPIIVDVLLDADGEIKRGIPYAGWWGRWKSTDVWPFIAKEIDGVYMIDFGSDESTNQIDRYCHLNLLHGPLKPRKTFKLKYGDDWYSFVVRELVDMITGRPID